MSEAICTKKAPYVVEAEAGKTYYYCTCGKSENQPFCDGSHKGSSFTPTAHTAEKTGNVYFCGCRASKKGALCDGEHKNL
ncbi:CDGSH iron-sulfur domain-containing protein [Magnetovibrio blakemorei]|uniref:Glutamate synthase n=1 Tax=Magnetovibrio blakemorei TaxID=28181 RepID=A0A1E5Q7L4_9PROT|nr:CDGSH iron-sulfur domain-containing protein [Magnetovibrio blakemorei]OEJ67130.1 glutamate synthase [Magnetovibrio blakemorei]